jgi:predicted phage-related endonuclease
MNKTLWTGSKKDRRYFVGGSDARIIMGDDEPALLRLWREKRGEVKPEDLSRNLVVQLGTVTEELNRAWYEANTGQSVVDVQKHVQHPALRWMAATLDGRVQYRPRNMPRNCSIICGWWRRGLLCCPSSPVAASGLRSRPMPIRFTSISY